MPFLVMVVTVKVKWEQMIEHSVTELLVATYNNFNNSAWSLTPELCMVT